MVATFWTFCASEKCEDAGIQCWLLRLPPRSESGATNKATTRVRPFDQDRPTRLLCYRKFSRLRNTCLLLHFKQLFFKHLGGDDVRDATGERPSSSKAVSTISVAFSPDARTMASTHGDHSVKITCCSTGVLLKSLEGHPRTPWTVKYHPLSPEILASGCLGFQVRVWNWEQGQCLQMIRLDYAIISLSFHPSGHILAIASGTRLHFWDYDNAGGRLDDQGRKSTRGVLTEVEQRHMLRCVHFPPNGKSVIVGGMNPNENRQGRIPTGAISFYLKLWDFDLDVALHPETGVLQTSTIRRKSMGNVSGSVCLCAIWLVVIVFSLVARYPPSSCRALSTKCTQFQICL